MGELAGRVALVTGAGSGIGKATALLFAREGAGVALADVNRDLAEQAEAEIAGQAGTAMSLHCDVSDAAQVQSAVDAVVGRFGRIDILVNSAGSKAGRGRTDETPVDAWEAVMGVNLTGSFLTSRAVIPVMLGNGGGSIINLGSIYGAAGLSGEVAYAVSKGGVTQLTRTTALEYARSGIRVNCIAPGFIQTQLLGHESSSLVNRALGPVSVPMGRLGTPEEVAELALFLASPRASYITGAIITVDGGVSAR